MAGIRKAGLIFDQNRYVDAVKTGNYSGAMGNAQLGTLFNELDNKSPDYGAMNVGFLQGSGALDRASMDLSSRLHAAGITGDYAEKASKILGKASEKAAGKAASGAKTGGILSGLGSIAGAAIGLSDESTKTNIEPIENALEILRGLKPVSFHYNEDYSCTPERLHYGFIAQDYAKVMPDATYYDESIDKLAIDRTELIGLLVRAVQQLEGRITRMEAKQVLEEIK